MTPRPTSRRPAPRAARWLDAVTRRIGADLAAAVDDGVLLCDCADGRSCS